jgi:hypothetical protein
MTSQWNTLGLKVATCPHFVHHTPDSRKRAGITFTYGNLTDAGRVGKTKFEKFLPGLSGTHALLFTSARSTFGWPRLAVPNTGLAKVERRIQLLY